MASTSENMGLTLPDINDTVADTIPALAANFDIIDKFFPVNSVVINTDGANPGDVYGGTWSQFAQGRCLIGASSEYPAGTTGGSTSHTHGKAQDGTSITTAAGISGSYVIGKGNYVQTTDTRDPYFAVYFWRRVS